jgi:hypothetical protein
MSTSILIDKLPAEIDKWKKIIDAIEKENSHGIHKLQEGEIELFETLKNYWKYNDFNPNDCLNLINEFKKHEPYHAPRWDELGEFRRICVMYYTKNKDAFEAFQKSLGGKEKRKPKQTVKLESYSSRNEESKISSIDKAVGCFDSTLNTLGYIVFFLMLLAVLFVWIGSYFVE